ncbi:HipA domain-containing protein [Epilithonimonas ginsengisoli]|uniref:HipA domain-containing protein n=1 Tax=Epilithonimonas ginsengisoli TaxID=1245592 RepID=A0ABU4JGU1_9FLAO|nr:MULTISPECIES: HipA domain-containing protein [Chryseobacterium group]MBV6878764.1 HipA domain-containing protein [Epilithonimonas sp. FP105]MDW8548905.1 HipA domain-containing protein [Epilithonimonas ginsengisoli]OAH75593.1 phosphatidylinositol kinase [Chryseobacterium sp. FP211-J200]
MNKCLFCYQLLKDNEVDFHPKCSKIIFGTATAPVLNYSLSEMEILAKEVIETSISVPGVQPKLSLNFTKEKLEDGTKGRLTVLEALGGNYILKPQNMAFPQMPENEHLTMRLAELSRIQTVVSSLIRLKSGELSYITKRIDRTASNGKIHMLDMFQITEASDKYKSSMEKVGKAVNEYSSNTLLDVLRLYEVVIFSYITGNNDMHLKNFSMILQGENWVFSPAYDLLNVQLHLPEDKEETALTIGGKKSRLTKADFINLGLKFGLSDKQIANIFNRFIKAEKKMMDLIDISFLMQENKMIYKDLLNYRFQLFKNS